MLVVVTAAYDPEARVWFVENSGELHGVNAEAPTLEGLLDKLPAVVRDLLDCEDDGEAGDVPIELVAHARTRVSRDACA